MGDTRKFIPGMTKAGAWFIGILCLGILTKSAEASSRAQGP